jgi:hypothetical protein
LFEFENVFDFDLNPGFKFKTAAKIFQKHFYFLLAAQNSFRPTTPCSTPILFSFSLILFSAGPVSFSAQRAHPTQLLAPFWPAPLLSSSFGHLAVAAVPVGTVVPCALGSCLSSPAQHPLPSRGKVKHHHHPFISPTPCFPSPFPRPLEMAPLTAAGPAPSTAHLPVSGAIKGNPRATPPSAAILPAL